MSANGGTATNNPFLGSVPDLISPAEHLYDVTPSDDELPMWPRALYVGGAGHLTVLAIGDDAPITLFNVSAGTTLRCRVKKVLASSTATHIVAMY